VTTATATATASRRRRSRSVLPAISTWTYIVISALIVLPPVVWIVSTSLKPEADTIKFPPEWIPSPITFDNYLGLLTATNIRFFINSLLYAAGSIVLALAICIPAAYVATAVAAWKR
jgi:multiple sugar transport system permease protein